MRAVRSVQFRLWRYWDNVLKALLFASLAARRPRRLRDREQGDVCVITATWNTADQLETLIRALERYSDPTPPLIVVDNASKDGTAELLRRHPEIQWIRLRRNWGHGLAVDLGVHAARTRTVVVMDVDAFPISTDWLESVTAPLRDGYTLAGALSSGYIHPCFMAIDRQRFLAGGHTFAASYSRRLRWKRRGQPAGWDAGQLISIRDDGEHFGLPPTSVRGPGALGTVFGDVVYHHFYSSRLAGPLMPDVIRSGVTPEISRHAWNEALAKYLS
jgi:glycosyltransferase involved in cell wall biosynthesis